MLQPETGTGSKSPSFAHVTMRIEDTRKTWVESITESHSADGATLSQNARMELLGRVRHTTGCSLRAVTEQKSSALMNLGEHQKLH